MIFFLTFLACAGCGAGGVAAVGGLTDMLEKAQVGFPARTAVMLAVFLLAVAGFCMTNSTLVTVLAMAVGLSAGAAVVIYGACAGGK